MTEMRSLVKALVVVSAVVMMMMLLYDQSRERSSREPLLGHFSGLVRLKQEQSNNSTDSAGPVLDEDKLRMLTSLTLKELEELMDKVSAPEPRVSAAGPRPQVGIGRRSAPPKLGKVTKTLVDAMLEKVKMHVLEDVAGVNYTTLLRAALQGKPLSDHPHPKPVKVVIVSTWRSGSTFLEELLSSHPAVFDIYEPLLMYELRRLREGLDAEDAQNIIGNLLQCRYKNDSYLSVIRKLKNMLERNREVHKICKTFEYGTDVCYDLRFLTTACQLFPWTLMKLVRLKLGLMEPFLESPYLYPGLQVVYLVRDPRAVINSRRSTVGWCKETSNDCYSPVTLCQDMDEDLQSAVEFQKRFPGKVHILRYEDMANDPFNVTQRMLDTIGLDYDPKIKDFLVTHTTKEINEPWTTSRKSRERLLYWTQKLPWRDIEEVQGACSFTMQKFGYLPVTTTENLQLGDVLKELSISL